MSFIDFLSEWIRNIILVMIIGTFLEFLIPRGSLKKPVRIILGLFLLLVLLQPLGSLLNLDPYRLSYSFPEENGWMRDFEEVEEENETLIRQQFKEALHHQIESMVRVHPSVEEAYARVDLGPQNEVRAIWVRVFLPSEKGWDEIQIDPIEIDPEEVKEEYQDLIKELQGKISSFYGISERYVTVEIIE